MVMFQLIIPPQRKLYVPLPWQEKLDVPQYCKGASASAMVYSISETAKLNNLRPYYYFKYILTELPKLCDERGNIDPTELDYLMPWSDSLPDECRKPRRS